MAVFNPWFHSKKDPAQALFAQYMTNWVAGVKLIFIVLLVVILVVGNELTKVFAVGAMILSIATYYVRLHPILKKLDQQGEITPQGYSNTLFWMITGFMMMFTLALIIYFVL